MNDIRWMFGRSKNKYEIKGVKYLDIHFQEEGEDWSYYKPTDRPYRCIYVFEAEEDEEEEPVICVKCNRDFSQEIDDRSSFEEIGKIICEKCFLEEDEEEEVRCVKCNIPLTEDDINCGDGQNCEDCGYETCANCDTILTMETPIMCYTEPDGNDFTVCSVCYWDCKYYETDINEDNKEEIEERLN